MIFDKKQRVLLCHRRDMDLWNLPGGGMESGELPTETAVRETLEETGLHIEILKLVGIYGKPDKDDLVFTFLGHVTGGQLIQTDEADELAYFAVDKLPRKYISTTSRTYPGCLETAGFSIFSTTDCPIVTSVVADVKRHKKECRIETLDYAGLTDLDTTACYNTNAIFIACPIINIDALRLHLNALGHHWQ